MNRHLLAFACGTALAFAAASCSLTTAQGFTECITDVECGSRAVCSHGYCVPLPARCEKKEGSFNTFDRIPLAALLPLTDSPDGGAEDASERAGLDAMRLAVGEVNAQQGLAGRLFALYTCDTGRSSDEIVAQTKWMISQLQVPAIITSGSSQTIAAYRAASDAPTFFMSATSTAVDLVALYNENQAHLLWRTSPPDSQQAKVISTLLRTDPTYTQAATPRRIGIIYEDGSYGHGLTEALATDLTNNGKDVRTIQYDAAALDPNAVLNELQSFAPNVTVLVSFPPAVKDIVRAAKQRQSLTHASGHRWAFADAAKDPAIVDAYTAPEIDGALGTAPAMGVGPAFRDFADRYRTRFHVDPALYGYTAQSYDAMYLVMLTTAWGKYKGLLNGANLAEGMSRVSAVGQAQVNVGATGWQTATAALSGGASIDLKGASGELDYSSAASMDTGAPTALYEVWSVHADGGIKTERNVSPP